MIEGLDILLESKGQPGLSELRVIVQELLGGSEVSGRLIDEQKLLRSRVYRLRFEVEGDLRSLVVKRFSPDRAQREQLVVQRWLPAVGLAQNGSPLIAMAAERTGQYVWHVYEDLGDCTLDACTSGLACIDAVRDRGFLSSLAISPDPERIEVTVKLIAEIHARFAGHALLGECRLYGGDLGSHFYSSNVTDAIRCLESIVPPDFDLPFERLALRDRLLQRMYELLDQQSYRAQLLQEYGGADTLLHGDLSIKNTLVFPTETGLEARLIDWDHMGVGPVSYDLSNFLVQFPIQDRWRILDRYQEAMVRPEGYCLSISTWNELFETAEYARLANSVIWPAIAYLETQPDWAIDELAQLDKWFEMLEPVLPVSITTGTSSAGEI